MNFKEWFDQMNSSKSAMARVLGIHVDTVNKLLRGHKPKKAMMKKLSYKGRGLKLRLTKEMFEDAS